MVPQHIARKEIRRTVRLRAASPSQQFATWPCPDTAVTLIMQVGENMLHRFAMRTGVRHTSTPTKASAGCGRTVLQKNVYVKDFRPVLEVAGYLFALRCGVRGVAGADSIK
jgi:hypothetical protein